MPTETNRFIKKTISSMVAGGILISILAASSLWLVFSTQYYVESAVQARRIRSASVDLLLTIQTAESGQRGYLLTQNDTFLAPYESSIQDVSQKLDTLAQLLVMFPIIEIDVPALKASISAKLTEMETSLKLAKLGMLPQAYELVRNESGLRLMGDIRSTIRSVIDKADLRILQQLESQGTGAGWLKIVTIVATITMLLLMAAVTSIIARFVRDILKTRNEMVLLNQTLEARVRERTGDVMRANQEIQRYAYIVTHDLRSPLVNIMGFTSELEKAGQTFKDYLDTPHSDVTVAQRLAAEQAISEDLPEAVTFIRSSTRKMDGLINAILKISRDGRRPLKPEPIDLKALVTSSANAIQFQLKDADAKIDMNLEISDCISDRFSLEQIFANLFDNALKYRDPSRQFHLQVNVRQDGPLQLRIEIADNGRGIADEDRERIFELFRRAGKQDLPGEGIGLAHVRSLLGNLGGDIRVFSTIGHSSSFVIRMPSDLRIFMKSNER